MWFPGVNFMDILWAPFCTKVLFSAFLYIHYGFEIFWQKNIGAKAARKMWMKLTTVLLHRDFVWSIRIQRFFSDVNNQDINRAKKGEIENFAKEKKGTTRTGERGRGCGTRCYAPYWSTSELSSIFSPSLFSLSLFSVS